MLSIFMGICMGGALGWAAFLARTRIALSAGTIAGAVIIALMILYRPTSVAAASLDMGLLQFARHAVFVWFDEAGGRFLSWMLVSGLLGFGLSAVRYKAFEPEPLDPETREQARARLNRAMKYDNPYLD